MTLTQQTFFGASIRNFNGSLGWGSQASTLNVGLVEDDKNGDNFNPPSIGSAVVFEYSDWYFGGILQSYQREYGQQGNPVYSVQLQDPRELLEGVQLILADYSGGTGGVPNLYNIYGYLEAAYGFGGSQINETGMPWWLIRDAFYNLQLSTPILFRGNRFLLDPFFGLDLLPNYYRIGGDHISALDYITDICDAICCDFFIDMRPLEGAVFSGIDYAIKIRLVSRNYTLRNNAINDFVESTEGAVAKQSGYELSNEVMSKFVVGGKLNDLYFQSQYYTYNNDEDDASTYADDVILPYWGEDANDNLIIGTGNFYSAKGKDYKFTIDGRPLYLQTGNQGLINYETDLAEMRAARVSRETWETFLWMHSFMPESIHYNKAEKIGIQGGGSFSSELMLYLKDWKAGAHEDLPNWNAARNMNCSPAAMERRELWNKEQDKQVQKIYAYIKKYATEYYGRKFLVRTPFIWTKVVPEENRITHSLLPTDAGYVAEEYWGSAATNGYLPYNPEKLTTQENKIHCYARFGGMSEVEDQDFKSIYGFDKLPKDSFILDQIPNMKLGVMRENLFVKCSIEPNLYFTDKVLYTDPRALVTLDGPVTDALNETESDYTASLEELKYWLKDGEIETTQTEVDEWVEKFGVFAGNDFAWTSNDCHFYMPDMVAVPLENQILRYGPPAFPWYYVNGNGKVDFENDSTLVPWNYGGFAAMNQAGLAKVQEAIRSQQVHEKGSVEFPGVPSLCMGDALLSSGPIVTDINIDISENGVTTTYRMATWTHQFGRLGKYNVERFSRLSKLALKQRKAFRKLYGYPEAKSLIGMDPDKHNLSKHEPSVMVFYGEVAVEGEGDEKTVRSTSAAAPAETLTHHFRPDSNTEKAVVSIDGVLVPFSTKTNSETNLPKFETPTSDEEDGPTCVDLNPYGGGSIGFLTADEETDYPNLRDGDGSSAVKSIGLRGPVIIAGWGYDLDGNPVPSGDGDDGFYPNYKNRADKWKAGPLDVRWDDERKVWSAVGESASTVANIDLFKLKENLLPGGHAEAWSVGVSGSADGVFVIESGSVTELYDFMLVPGTQHFAEDKVVAASMQIPILGSGGVPTGRTTTKWIVINGQCSCA